MLKLNSTQITLLHPLTKETEEKYSLVYCLIDQACLKRQIECLTRKLKEAEQRITELLCEIEGLQRCLDKAECDALQMVHIIEEQQVC